MTFCGLDRVCKQVACFGDGSSPERVDTGELVKLGYQLKIMEEEMMTPQARRYDREFKLQTVRLLEESDKPMRVIAEELGISVNTLSLWKKAVRESGQMAFPEGGLTEDQRRIRELEKELKDVRMERDILKKAVAIFSTKK